MAIKDPFIGRQFANYRIERLLGRGGMAAVYYGWDVRLERPVAVKVIDTRYRGDPGYAERFLREARAVAGWQHPNILQVYYAGDADGLYYYVMEYIEGADLAQLLKRYARRSELLPFEDVLRIGRATAAALDYAHQKGVIHRDVKPSNILVSEGGRVALSDFGLAMDISQGSMGEVFGSPHYMAPEQARSSAAVVPQSDLYALGIVLYEMLAGSLPFDDPSPATLALKQITDPPPSPRVFNPYLNPAVERVLLKALRKDPRERYPTGRELIEALEDALTPAGATEPVLANLLNPDASQAAAGRAPAPRALSTTPVAEEVTQAMNEAPAEAGGLPGIEAGLVEETPAPPPQVVLPAPPLPAKEGRLNPLAVMGGGCGLLVVVAVALIFLGTLLALRKASDLPGLGGAASTPGGLLATQTRAVQLGTPAAARANTPPSPGEPTQAPVQEPTQALATGGGGLEIYYNEESFYVKNVSGQELSVFSVAFERLDKDGKPIARFDGWRWGQIYSRFRNDYCVEILVFGKADDYLNPEACQDRALIVRTPTEDQEIIFWTKDKDSHEFRVLWDDQEIGRCKTGKGPCEVKLP